MPNDDPTMGTGDYHAQSPIRNPNQNEPDDDGEDGEDNGVSFLDPDQEKAEEESLIYERR